MPFTIWRTSDRKLLVGHERGNRVTAIDTNGVGDAGDDVVAGTVGGSATDLGFMKRLIDVVVKR